MKKIAKVLCISCAGFVALLACMYFAGARYFVSRFNSNIWINGYYCTGKTAYEINEELVWQTVVPETYTLQVYEKALTEQEGQDIIALDSIDFKADYSQAIQEIMQENPGSAWIRSVFETKQYEVEPVYSFSTDKLQQLIGSKSFYTQEEEPLDFYLTYIGAKQGYSFYDGTHNRLNRDKLMELIIDGLLKGQDSLNAIETGCYYDAELTVEQQKAKALWERIEEYSKQGPFYDFEEDGFYVSEKDMLSFLVKGDDHMPLISHENGFVLDETAVADYIEKLGNDYDTYQKKWDFNSTRGELIKVQGVTYGGLLDRPKELEWLTAYLEQVVLGQYFDEEARIHVPEYTRKPYYRGNKSVGSTYIEVDMGDQKLYYYEKGKLQLETDIVTGNMKRKMSTPEGVNFIYGMQKNRVLRGPNYATFVKYWMPVKGNIGLHDASWRKEFGGDIFETNGSHGCVNIPTEAAGDLYDSVELGIPVVMFY